jgi:PAS domain S-box-containing protein/diguanylate cyclase (GGDEF)-like protein
MALFKRQKSTQSASEAEIRRLLLREFEESGADWLWETDAARRVVSPSARFADACGLEQATLNGMPFLQVLAGPTWETGAFAAGLRTLAEKLKGREPFRDLRLPVPLSGQERWWELAASPRLDEDGTFLGFIGVGSDVTEQREAADRITRLARYDQTTGIPNRLLVSELANRACIEASRWEGSRVAILLLSLTNIVDVRLRLGYAETDTLLLRTAEALAQQMDGDKVVGQLAPGEFVIIWRDASNAFAVDHELQKFAATVRNVDVPNRNVELRYAAGEARYPEDGATGDAVMTAALSRVYGLGGQRGTGTNSSLAKLQSSAAQGTKGEASQIHRSLIIQHGPAASAGLLTLIEEHERRLHNRPPEPINAGSLSELKQLKQELDELIVLAENKKSVDGKLSTVASLTKRVFRFAKETGEVFVAGMRPLVASIPAAVGTLLLLQAICTPAVGAVAGPGAALAILAGYYEIDKRRSGGKADD